MKALWAPVMVLCILATSAVSAQSGGGLSLVASVRDARGAAVDSELALQLTLFETETGGEPLWQGAPVQLTADADGVVVHELGKNSQDEPLDHSLFDGRELFMELSIGGEVLSPRLLLGTLPYALRASRAARAAQVRRADRLGDYTPGELALRAHDHQGRYLSHGGQLGCTDGQKVIGLQPSGEVLCGPDADSSYGAGEGLAMDAELGQLSVAAAGVRSEHLKDGAVKDDHFAQQAVQQRHLETGSLTTAKFATGAVEGRHVEAGQIGAARLKDGGLPVYSLDQSCQDEAFTEEGSPSHPRVLTRLPTCKSRVCARLPDKYLGCASYSCNQNAPDICDNTLVGHAVPE